MFYNYVLQSLQNGNLYIGYTDDLKRRLREHNNGSNTSTKSAIPWKVIYYEACIVESDAIRREQYLKTSQGKRLLKLRLRDYLHNTKL